MLKVRRESKFNYVVFNDEEPNKDLGKITIDLGYSSDCLLPSGDTLDALFVEAFRQEAAEILKTT